MANWFIDRSGNRIGPITQDVLTQMLGAGQVAPGDLVWTEGQPNWQRADSYPWFPGNATAPPATPGPAQQPQVIQPGQVFQTPAYTPAPPPSLLVWAIFELICCGIGGIIGGIMGLICDSNAKSAYLRGDYALAHSEYEKGKKWMIWSLVISFAFGILCGLLAAAVGIFGAASSNIN